ncbi:sugar transferase [Enterococcus casseliflavus]|uniref:sugar transferase n=1 Tax=Enterococcus TaxID=1350 RepID=UPI00289F9496|nr:sugar transferase [Enterococcus sp.]
MYKKYLKRVLDAFFSLVLLVILSPIILITGVAIKLDDKGPIFFKQKRLGRKGIPYYMYKFRSMKLNSEKTGVYTNKGDSRVTKVGKFIRATSIDELPQLLNILKGDMSFIGPRPALTYHPWEFSEYTFEQRRMFDIRPGLSGWAQVHGRKEVPWPERIEMNVWYVNNESFLLDLKIIFLTFFNVLFMKDNYNTKDSK